MLYAITKHSRGLSCIELEKCLKFWTLDFSKVPKTWTKSFPLLSWILTFLPLIPQTQQFLDQSEICHISFSKYLVTRKPIFSNNCAFILIFTVQKSQTWFSVEIQLETLSRVFENISTSNYEFSFHLENLTKYQNIGFILLICMLKLCRCYKKLTPISRSFSCKDKFIIANLTCVYYLFLFQISNNIVLNCDLTNYCLITHLTLTSLLSVIYMFEYKQWNIWGGQTELV